MEIFWGLVILISLKEVNFKFPDPWVRRTPGEGEWQPTPVFLPGESQAAVHGSQLDTAEWLSLSLSKVVKGTHCLTLTGIYIIPLSILTC